MQRYLFELVAVVSGARVERRSEWISDDWLAAELARDSNTDRIVDFEPDGLHILPDPPIGHIIKE